VASLTATPEAVDEGIDITFDASASTDSENDPLTFSYVQISGPALNLDNAGISFTTSAPEVDVDSVVTLEVQVSDGHDISTQRVDVDIRNIEQMPAFPLTLEIDRTLSIEGELFDINGFLNPSDTGLIAVSDIDGGQVGLRAIEVGSDTEFLPGSIELLTPQFERDLEIMEGEFSSYLVIESNGVTFLQQDTSFRDPVLNVSGRLDINGVCASQMTSLSFTSAGGIIIFGRTGGVDLYSYRGAVGVSGEIEFDFDSLTLQDSINDGNNYCALSIPRALEANGRNSSATSFMAFSTEDFDIQRFQIQDNGAGLLSLSPIFRIENSGLDASSQSFVKGLSNINLFNTMAVIVTDGSHNGRHSLQYIHDPINDRIPQPELIRMFTGNWSLGVPTDIALGDLDTSSENYLFAITPDTPQAVAFRFPLASSFLTPPLEPSFLEVGLGASLAFSDPARFGDERDDDFDGLILGYPEKREIRRFAVSDIAD